jgi:hypothetical protein
MATSGAVTGELIGLSVLMVDELTRPPLCEQPGEKMGTEHISDNVLRPHFRPPASGLLLPVRAGGAQCLARTG